LARAREEKLVGEALHTASSSIRDSAGSVGWNGVSREQTSFPSAPLPLNIIFTIAFPRSVGQVTKVANGVIYFPGTQQITDPSVAAVISANGLNGNFTKKAITDAKGNLLFVNPAPG
jgi:hypothetical protein